MFVLKIQIVDFKSHMAQIRKLLFCLISVDFLKQSWSKFEMVHKKILRVNPMHIDNHKKLDDGFYVWRTLNICQLVSLNRFIARSTVMGKEEWHIEHTWILNCALCISQWKDPWFGYLNVRRTACWYLYREKIIPIFLSFEHCLLSTFSDFHCVFI